MKEISELNLPQDLKYCDDHEWAKKEGDSIIIGITDYAQDQLGEVVFAELPELGDVFNKGDEFGSLESVKAVSEIYIPVSGEITAVNEALEDNPDLVNDSCYNDGWLIKVSPSDASELDQLMDCTAYLDMLQN